MIAKHPQPPFEKVTMGAGANPNTNDLAITYAFSEHKENDGRPFILIEYELTDHEIARLKKEKRLRIAIMGTGMSPILPFVEGVDEMGFYPADISTGKIIDPRNFQMPG